MTLPNEGRRIVWLVRMLTALGLLVVVITLALVGWTLAKMRSERASETIEQERLDQASDALRAAAVESRQQIQDALDETAAPTELSGSKKLLQLVQSQISRRQAADLTHPLIKLEMEAKRLNALADRAKDWRTSFDQVQDDVRHQRTMGKVRELIDKLRGMVETLEGSVRLKDAMMYRRWRAAAGEEALRQAQEILIEQGRRQSHGTSDFKSELNEFARLVELLGGEEQIDNIADLKDNRLKPVLDRLSRIARATETSQDGSDAPAPRVIQDLTAAIFGPAEGEPDAQRPSRGRPGGLIALRRDALQLRRDGEKLKNETAALFQDIEAANTHFTQAAQIRIVDLAQGMELRLTSAWWRMLIIGGSCSAMFLWLSWLISRGIRKQVNALEQAREEAEAGRQTTQKLMLAQQAAAAELESLHKKLVEASRQAGRADIATGILHNVGNVLNSVNVAANVLSDLVRRSKAPNVARAVSLLEANKADLPQFLTGTDKGRELPKYLGAIAGVLVKEQEAMAGELESLSRGIEHIKQIVQVQQSYAKRSNVLEEVEPASVIEDALKMNLLSFERHGIKIVRQFQEVPPLMMDKHKVLQALVNLVSNARHAMKDSAAAEKVLTVRLSQSDGDEGGCISIEVRDSGIGIPAENLQRIFSHGFTTRPTGHGFGLHWAINAAREMGGDLSVHSDGEGRGASFTLKLPRQAVEASV